MNKQRFTSWSTPVRAVVVAAAMVAGALPLIAQSQDSASAREIYRQDRANCLAGNTNQSQADCLYEARSALRDRLNGDPNLTDANEGGGMTASNSYDSGTTSTTTAMASTDSGSELAPRADRN